MSLRHHLRGPERPLLIAFAVVGISGLLLVLGSFYISYSNIALLLSGHRSSGLVMRESCYKRDCTSVIEFNDAYGLSRQKITASSNLSSGKVNLLFRQASKESPSDVTINSFRMMWLGPLLLAFFGSTLCLVGYGVIAQTLPQKKFIPKRKTAQASNKKNC